MPLVSREKCLMEGANSRLAVWKIDESEEILRQMCRQIRIDGRAWERIGCFKSRQRRIETLATYLALFSLCGHTDMYIGHDGQGRPLFPPHNISISHTKGYAAVIVSDTEGVGIDIEYISNRVDKVADYYLLPSEYADSLDDRILQWCAKETAFKFFADSRLALKDFSSSYDGRSVGQGRFLVKNQQNGQEITIIPKINDFFALTYTCG